MKKQGINPSLERQKGSAIVWILLMIALFAALNYAVSQGSRTNGDKISRENAKLAANDILNYGRTIREAVQTLQINGCDDTEISFDQVAVTGYLNSNAPPDNSCHVFHPNGGGVRLQEIEDSIQTIVSGNEYPRFLGSTTFTNAGSTDAELYLHVRSRSQQACTIYNDKVGITNISDDAPTENGAETTPLFVGAYSSGDVFGDDGGGASFSNFQTGCYKDANETDTDGTAFYDFYQILIAR